MKLITRASLTLALSSISFAPIAFADHHEGHKDGEKHECSGCSDSCAEKCSKETGSEKPAAGEHKCEHCGKKNCTSKECKMMHKKDSKKAQKKAEKGAEETKPADAAAPAEAH